MRQNVFTQRMVGVWNSLPEFVVEAETLNSFKKHLDLHLKCYKLQGYGRVQEGGIRQGTWVPSGWYG